MDEVEDGARCHGILEELVVAFVYSNARERCYYDNIKHLEIQNCSPPPSNESSAITRRSVPGRQKIGALCHRERIRGVSAPPEKSGGCASSGFAQPRPVYPKMITQPHVLNAPGAAEAWDLAAELLVNDGDRFNLAVHITDAASLNESEVARYDHTVSWNRASGKSVYDVANTIFQSIGRYHAGNLERFFTHYRRVYERGQKVHRTTWGVYFLRLISFGSGEENQLAGIIHALADWNCKPKAAFVVHLSSAALDSPRPLGAPYWQYGQFVRSEDNRLSLVAMFIAPRIIFKKRWAILWG